MCEPGKCRYRLMPIPDEDDHSNSEDDYPRFRNNHKMRWQCAECGGVLDPQVRREGSGRYPNTMGDFEWESAVLRQRKTLRKKEGS